MVTKLIMQHVTEWVEVGVVLAGLFVAAIAAASITLYKVDTIGNDVVEIKASLQNLPVVLQRIKTLEKDVKSLEDNLRIVEQRNWESTSG